MKLISCHVDGFGGIADKDYSFDPELTGILGENGAGKSTLAAFLSAMLYGMETANKRSVQFLDREHFRPFGGGAFGGTLVFACDGGDVYRVRRLFDEKTGTQDEVTVEKNGAPYDCRGREIGEILFGVDADAFSRTVFLSADTLDPDPGKSISDRLCEAVSNPEGAVSADKAIRALDDAATNIKKKKGQTGLLDQAVRAAADAEDALRAAQTEAKTLPELQEQDERLKKELAAERSRNLWRSYDELLARGRAAEAELARANARFANGAPDDEALSDAEDKIALREKIARDAETGFIPSARQAELTARFAAKRPDEAALAEMEGKAQAIRDAQAVQVPVAEPQNPSPEKPKSAGWLFPVAAIGGLLFLAGLIFLILSMTVPGAILLGVGVFDLGAAAFIMIQGKVTALEKSIAVVDPGGAERARRAQLDADLAALLAPYGYSSRDGALAAYADLKRDLAELAATEEQKADAAGRCAAAKERLTALDAEIAGFFAKYGIETDAGNRAAMNALRGAIRDREDAARKIKEAKDAAAKFAADQELSVRPAVAAEEGDPAARIRELEREKTALAVRIAAVARAANSVPELEDALNKAEDRVAELKLRYARLVAARDLLTQAQENLVRRYVEPVKTSFVAYADALASFLGRSVSLGSRFELTYEANGVSRDVRHLSAGERSVAALCLRMALADSLYAGKEQPPLILDDPLVHLDENNLARALPLLRKVAKRRQIVCLTCHPSRAV